MKTARARHNPPLGIIRDLDALKPNLRPVVALGNFDGVHLGHRAILQTAIDHAHAKRGAAFVLTFDPLPSRVLAPARAPQLILAPEDKLDLLRSSGIDGVIVVDFTLEFSQIGPREFVRDYILGKINARAVVVGHSVSFGHKRAGNASVMVELGREFGFAVTVVGPVKAAGVEVSSTKVRELIAAADLKGAADLLGRCHFLAGSVVRGRERGRRSVFRPPTWSRKPNVSRPTASTRPGSSWKTDRIRRSRTSGCARRSRRCNARSRRTSSTSIASSMG